MSVSTVAHFSLYLFCPHFINLIDGGKIFKFLSIFSLFFVLILLQSSAGPNVHLSHQTLRSNAWAVTPVLIDILNKLIKPQTRWLVLCEANSMVNVEKLLEKLSGEDDSEVSKQ